MKNHLTFKQLEYDALSLAKLKETDIDPEYRMQDINNALMKLYGALETKADPFYNFTQIITASADQELLASPNLQENGNLLSMNGQLKTITRNGGIFPLNALISVAVIDTAEDIRDNRFFTFTGRITEAGATATYELISGREPIFTFENFVHATCTIFKSLSVLTIDLSSLYIKNVISIYDNITRKGQPSFDIYTDSDLFRRARYDYSKRARISAYHRENSIDLIIGEDTALGTITLEYRGKPALYTDATKNSEVLIPPEYNTQLITEVAAMFVARKSVEIKN